MAKQTKKTKKTPAKKKTSSSAVDVPMMPKEPPRATIQKAANGFIVTGQYGEKPAVAKTLKEAQAIQEKYLK